MLKEGLRSGRRLDQASVRSYAVLIALISVAGALAVVAMQRDGFVLGQLIGSDFLSFWAAGRLAATGMSPYAEGAHLAAMRDFAPGLDEYPAYFYPPIFLIFCWPLGLLGYFPALALWLVATGMAYVAALRLWLRELKLHLPPWPWLVAFPPVLITVTHGQTSFLVGSLLGAGLLLVKRHPMLAGILLGLATIKPQLGLLVPVALLLAQCWRTIFAATATALLLAAAATLMFGFEFWIQWYASSDTSSAAMSSGAIGYGKMVSVFAGLKLMGASTAIAGMGQAIATATMMCLVAWTAWRSGWSPLLAALVLAGAPLSTPFVLDYDLVLLAFPLIYLAATGYRTWEKTVSAAVFVMPIFARPLGLHAAVPLAPVVLAALVLILVVRVATAHAKPLAGMATRAA